jgi:hypothetical protein
MSRELQVPVRLSVIFGLGARRNSRFVCGAEL